ncbi:taurine ABC transporter substrate-binding protein [Microvirga pakistanensis]|uniref:taurine ABC transporter substrate-binding protein n=1 Tax=Microvirga pakistanensis TaxID=1682650 RepID=UPI001FCE59AB|nr:taurine ABC transporter substrate-binding protein [Microvirga pakistanensis]
MAALVSLAGSAAAADKEVTFAYQDMVTPLRVLMDEGTIEEETGYKITWRKFGGGGDVVRAMASGAVQIGEAGSSPIATAASQGMDIQLFWILDDIADAEQLVVRNGSDINSIADLKGKTVATPFVSTAHFQLIFALTDAGVNPKEVTILNMRPPEIAAAWDRGDIDATFIWDPVLGKAKQNGKVLVSAGDLSKKGRATFDGIMVDRAWAEANKPFLVKLVKLIAQKDAEYKAKAKSWDAVSPEAKAISKLTGAAPADVPGSLAAYRFLSLDEQASADWLGGGAAKALAETAQFLKEQGRISALAPDYAKFVTDEYVKAAK